MYEFIYSRVYLLHVGIKKNYTKAAEVWINRKIDSWEIYSERNILRKINEGKYLASVMLGEAS